jgi:hypothetical protein
MLGMLEEYMGPANFEKGMKAYFDEWHFKHPSPENFRACMAKNTPKSLDWFFDAVLASDKKMDFAIKGANETGSQTDVTIRNRSGLLAPVKVDAWKDDSVIASAWSEPFMGSTKVTLPVTGWDKIKVDSLVPDAKSTNDVYKKGGIFRTFGLKVKPFFGLNRSEKYKVFLSPAIGYNESDGLMAGAIFHNLTIPENRFRFIVAPLYSFRVNSFAGAGSIGYAWYPESGFQDILLQADAKTFHNNETGVGLSAPLYSGYTKTAATLSFNLREKDFLSPVNRGFFIKGYSIWEDNFSFGTETKLVKEQKIYGMARYSHSNSRTYNPFSYNFEAQAGADFAKIAVEGTARVDYNTRNKSLYVRAYAGKFFAINNDPAVLDRYKLNASYSGIDDYLYDGTFLGRNSHSGKFAQQLSIQEGGFKIPVFNNVNRSDNWMATINLSSDLPKIGLPIRLFFDAGLIPNFSPTIAKNGATTLLYEGGIEIHSIKDVVSIYIPIIMSSDFQNYLKDSFGAKHSFERSISFTFMLQNVNWLRSSRNVLKVLAN